MTERQKRYFLDIMTEKHIPVLLDAVLDIYEAIISTSLVEYIVPAAAKSIVSGLAMEGLVGDII